MEDRHRQFLAATIRRRLPAARAFVFGSAVSRPFFRDVDVALVGPVDRRSLCHLEEDFEESDFPYKVDLVVLDEADAAFRDRVLGGEVQWLT